MDHNRRGLALMTAVLLISLLVVSVRSCNDKAVDHYSHLDRANAALVKRAHTLTQPIKDYQIISIENGYMEVQVGRGLTDEQLRTLARQLIRALREADGGDLGSELVMLNLKQGDHVVCRASSTPKPPPDDVWIRLHPGGSSLPLLLCAGAVCLTLLALVRVALRRRVVAQPLPDAERS